MVNFAAFSYLHIILGVFTVYNIDVGSEKHYNLYMARIVGYNRHPGSKWPQIAVLVIVGLVLAAIVFFSNVYASKNSSVVASGTVAQRNSDTRERKAVVSTTNQTTTTSTTTTVPSPVVNDVSKITIEKISFTNDVAANNRPVEDFAEIDRQKVGRVYCYTKVLADNLPQKIEHVWLDPDGNKFAEISLDIKSRPSHTWSYVTLAGRKAGSWQVQIQSADGQIIDSAILNIL